MSYEIVRSIKLVQKENKTWYAIINSACNNVRPHYYYKWDYAKNANFTKDELQQEILLDFYHGNFHGGLNTKYGKFIDFLGGWCAYNQKSRACRLYREFYSVLKNKLRNIYKDEQWYIIDEQRETYYKRKNKLENRCDRELKRQLLKEFKQFEATCKPTILRLWKNNESFCFLYREFRQKKGAFLTNNYNEATRFTDTNTINKLKTLAETNGYKVELIKL